MSLHENRRRAESFGAAAERYDRARPRYPDALLDDLLADGSRRVLDVGCGTGIVARQLLDRGCEVLGVEPDDRMAAVARASGVEVEVAPFEAWDPAGRLFDLVVSGQAWHWVDPAVGVPRAASVLPPRRRLATFWNWGGHDPEVERIWDDVYGEHAPELRQNSVALGSVWRQVNAADVDAAAAGGLFAQPEVRRYRWDRVHTRDDWLDQLPTHSDHALLPPERLSALLDAVGAAIDRLGGTLTLHYETVAVLASRSG